MVLTNFWKRRTKQLARWKFDGAKTRAPELSKGGWGSIFEVRSEPVKGLSMSMPYQTLVDLLLHRDTLSLLSEKSVPLCIKMDGFGQVKKAMSVTKCVLVPSKPPKSPMQHNNKDDNTNAKIFEYLLFFPCTTFLLRKENKSTIPNRKKVTKTTQ